MFHKYQARTLFPVSVKEIGFDFYAMFSPLLFLIFPLKKGLSFQYYLMGQGFV